MSIASSYAVRTFGFVVYYAAISVIIALLLLYSESLTPAVESILLVLLGGLATHSGTAFERFANPESYLVEQHNKELEAIQRNHSEQIAAMSRDLNEMKEKLITLQAAADARDRSQQATIAQLLTAKYGPVPPYGGTPEQPQEPRRLERKP